MPRLLSATPAFAPSEIRIAPFGTVAWANYHGYSVDVTFDDPTNVTLPPDAICNTVSFLNFIVPPPAGYTYGCDGVGNFVLPPSLGGEASPAYTMRLRRFLMPGVYSYRSVRTGATGRIVVSAGLD